jgi:hypothetical protein
MQARRNSIFTDILESFLTRPYRIPYDSIGTIDSRMWDPEWAGKYGSSYRGLYNSLNYGLKNHGRALSVASGESYRWGRRGGSPIGMLKSFDNLSLRQMRDRFMSFVQRIINGETLAQVLRIIGDPLATIAEQVEVPD